MLLYEQIVVLKHLKKLEMETLENYNRNKVITFTFLVMSIKKIVLFLKTAGQFILLVVFGTLLFACLALPMLTDNIRNMPIIDYFHEKVSE